MKRICYAKSVLNANLLKTMVAATLVGLSLGTASFAADANSLSLVGEGKVRYGQPQSNQTSTASGTFSYSLGEGKSKGTVTGFAVTLTPTLDTVKAESESYLNTSGHGQYTLSETSTGAANEHSIKLWDSTSKTIKTYYYTADETSADMNRKLVNLVNSGFAAMKDVTSTGNWVLKLGDTYYGYDTDELPSSVFSYSTGDSSDYTFKYTDGTTTSYYKVDLTPAKMSTSNTITFTKDGSAASDFVFNSDTKTGSGVVKVTLPHNGATEDEYYTYNYSQPSYTVTSSRINNSIVGTNVQNKIFYNILTSSNGGAIYNTQDKSGVSIISDFIRNRFSTNYYSVYGGAIYNSGTIGSIVGDFVGNSASGSSASGGAIYNYRTIGSIVGDFVGNYASSTSSSASGGAIYNYYGTIDSIVGDFVGNYAKTTSTSRKAYGGAIYNGSVSSGNPSYNANSKITLGGNTFTGNYVQQGSNDPVQNSIYNAGVINIADGATVTINDGWQTLSTNASQTGQLVMGTGSTLNMNIGNGTIQEDSLGKITNVGTINATVDVSISQVKADTIAVTFCARYH